MSRASSLAWLREHQGVENLWGQAYTFYCQPSMGEKVGAIAVHIEARVAALSPAGKVLVAAPCETSLRV